MNPSPTNPRLDPASLRIVLFGVPDAGKSSLLAALQTVAVQNHKRLQGHLDGNLIAPPTADAVDPPDAVVFPLTWQPLSPPGVRPIPLAIVDCNGLQCERLINHRAELVRNAAADSLEANVLDADALILAVDATAPDELLQQDFTRFARFLRFLRDYRSREHTVGGLPVWLTLTKCDRLAAPGDNRRQWEAKVEARSGGVGRQFADFLVGNTEDNGMLGFGSLSLRVAATAIRRPAFGDAPGDEPFGIPELFHDAILAAGEYDSRQNRASRRLTLTLAGAGGVLGLLLAAGVAFYESPSEGTIRPVQEGLDLYRQTDSSVPEIRLKGDLAQRIERLKKLESDPEIALLTEKDRTYIRTRREELESYVRWYDSMRKAADPARMRTLREMETLEGQLRRDFVPPEARASEWATTDGVLLRNRLLKELPVLMSSARELRAHFAQLRQLSTDLLFAKDIGGEWNLGVENILAPKKPPFPETDPERGAAWNLAEVVTAKQDFENSLERLRMLRDIATAAGLVGDPSSARAVLTTGPVDPNDYLKSVSARLAALRREFAGYRNWNIAAVPENIRPTIQKKLQSIYGREIGQSQVMLDDKRASDTPAGWQKLAEVLTTAPLADWRDWIGTLSKLADPEAEDPAVALSSFIRQTSFEVSLRSLRLRIPPALHDAKVLPSGKLTIRYGSDPKNLGAMSFEKDGDGFADKENYRNYVFAPVADSPKKMTWKPGDVLYAELDITEFGEARKITWTRGRSLIWQIARLRETPQIHKPMQPVAEGTPARGVGIIEEGTWPTIPILLRDNG